jgi:guanylate kinase
MVKAENTNKKTGIIVIVSGPSGVGKSTISKELVKRLKDVYLSVSVTTRPKSEIEIDGNDYWFISKKEFQERIDKGLFLEYAEVFGNLYGTPKDKIIEALDAGKTVILEIDVQGARQTKAVFPDAEMIFILPPSAKTLAERLNNRGRDAEEVAEERLGEASSEIASAWQYYKHMVINQDLQQAINECIEIIEKARSENPHSTRSKPSKTGEHKT